MKIYALIFVLGLFLVACDSTIVEPQTPTENNFSTENVTDTESTEDNASEDTSEETEYEGFSLTYTEGELVALAPEAIDPDGDVVTYAFGAPLNREGMWQTEIGDEGDYLVSIVATDGDLQTESSVLLIIERANRAPVIDCVDTVTLNEGERFYVGNYCEFFDEDKEDVVVEYSGWPGVSRYVTTYDDAGRHVLFIQANDKMHIVKHELPIVVLNTNRASQFPENFPAQLVGVEGDILTIDTSDVVDPDGDKLSFQFSEPFDNKGVWKTMLGDAGIYDVDVVVSDGDSNVKRTVIVEVQLANTKPVLKTIPDITVKEGETIVLPISASDREGDDLLVDISGWMTSDTRVTTYDDAGEYTVKVVVSDGVHTTSQIVHVVVENVNRAPEFVSVA